MVVDRSQGQDVVWPLEAYYNVGDLDEDHVWRFIPEEAETQLRKQRHYAPWIDG